jgi:cytosine/adenosine deaminase-related metal-dependent hydrolase
MWQGLLRNIGPNDLLGDYLTKILFGFAPKLTSEDVYLGNLITALSAMNAGITCILDWSHIATSSAHTDAAIQGLRDANIRAVYGYGPNFGLKPAWHEDPKSVYPKDIQRLRRDLFSSADQLLTLALAAAGPEFAPVDAAVREWTIAREVGARISVHVGVGLLGTKGLLQALGERVPLKDDTTYIHCCTLSDREWRMIADSGATISLAVPIEMQMGHGMPPIQKTLDSGLRPSLSIDVETNQPTDMFTQMRACFALQRALVNAKNLFGGPEPDRAKLLTVRDVLEFATIEGAKANGLANRIGTLTPGKQADVIVLRASSINVTPLNDVIGDVVLGMDSGNVDSVFINGRPVKREGRLLDVDLAALQRRAQQAHDALLQRAGIAPSSL